MKLRFALAIAALCAAPLAHAQDNAASKAYSDAMAAMMQNMHMQPTGNADKDFVMMMIPHHQGAIDMAKVQLQYGKDPQIKKLAEAVVVAQEKEIAEMKEWLAKNP